MSVPMPTKRCLIVGCGYLGGRVAQRWIQAGHAVAAVTRTPAHAAELSSDGIHAIVADVTRPKTLEGLPSVDTLLYSVSFDAKANVTRDAVYRQGLEATLTALPTKPDRVVFTSSTGVYGQTDGSLVDETSVCEPLHPGGMAMLDAEQWLQQSHWADRALVLRFAGTYGEGRIPRMRDLLAGRPIIAPKGGCLNLIHVDDAAEAVVVAAQRAVPPNAYLVSDGHPTTHRDFYGYLAELLASPPPEFREPSPEDRSRLRSASNKRVSNARILTELDLTLRYPSYRQGLAAILADQPRQDS